MSFVCCKGGWFVFKNGFIFHEETMKISLLKTYPLPLIMKLCTSFSLKGTRSAKLGTTCVSAGLPNQLIQISFE